MANLKIETNEFEIFADGKLVATANGWNEFEKKSDEVLDGYLNNGYKEIESLCGNYVVLSNVTKGVSVFIGYRRWFGFCDKNGQKIYYNDVLQDSYGNIVDINQHWEDDRQGEYYFRIRPGDRNTFHDIEIENMDFIEEYGVEVKKRAFDF